MAGSFPWNYKKLSKNGIVRKGFVDRGLMDWIGGLLSDRKV